MYALLWAYNDYMTCIWCCNSHKIKLLLYSSLVDSNCQPRNMGCGFTSTAYLLDTDFTLMITLNMKVLQMYPSVKFTHYH